MTKGGEWWDRWSRALIGGAVVVIATAMFIGFGQQNDDIANLEAALQSQTRQFRECQRPGTQSDPACRRPVVPSLDKVDELETQEKELQEVEIQEREIQQDEIQNAEVQESEKDQPEIQDREFQNPEINQLEQQEIEEQQDEIQDDEVQDEEIQDEEEQEAEEQEPEIQEQENQEPENQEPENDDPDPNSQISGWVEHYPDGRTVTCERRPNSPDDRPEYDCTETVAEPEEP